MHASVQASLEAYEKSYIISRQNECFDAAYLSAYTLLIYWLYAKLWFMCTVDPERVRDLFVLHSFDSNFDQERFLIAEEPSALADLRLEDKKYSKIFSRLCLSNEGWKKLRALTDKRNKIAHPSGQIIYGDEEALESALEDMLELVESISKHFTPLYVAEYTREYTKLNYRKIKNWEKDINLEHDLVSKRQLSAVDLENLTELLKAA
jgi:hypothetical protein